jgi:hypothetical protein
MAAKNTLNDFWNRVAKTESCWAWTGPKMKSGYGTIGIYGKKYLAHRFSYELDGNVIPDGFDVDHLCRNRSCVNPDHLEAVSHRENLLRGETTTARNAAKTHCPQGHLFAGENLYQRNGIRMCRQCRKETAARRNQMVAA